MTSVERLKFLADKGDECWLGLSNVEAIKDVLNQLELSKKVIVRKNARLNEYAEDLVKGEKVIHELVMYLLETENENIKDIVCDNCPHQECQNYEGKITNNCIKEYFYRKVEDKGVL